MTLGISQARVQKIHSRIGLSWQDFLRAMAQRKGVLVWESPKEPEEGDA